MAITDKIEVENINTPGRTSRVNREKYIAARAALLKVLPNEPPGLSAVQAKDMAKPHLPQDLFPGGATSGWWMKTVQLDLEAKGIVARTASKPLTFYRADQKNAQRSAPC